MTKYKYQHTTPRTYYRHWEKDDRQLKFIDKITGIIDYKSSKKHFGIDDFYTITIDNFYIFNDRDKQEVYKILFNYKIEFNNQILDKIENFHYNLSMFEEWNIQDKAENQVNNDVLHSQLKSIRILDVEMSLNEKIESKWNNTIKKVKSCLNSKTALKEFDYDSIYTFITVQMIRTEVFKKEYISKDKDFFNLLFNFSKSNKQQDKIDNDISNMLDSIFKNDLRDFINGRTNNKTVNSIIKIMDGLSFVFYHSKSKTFYTSDNPIISNQSKLVPDKYRGLILPLTPNIIAIGFKGNKKNYEYFNQELSETEVDELNKIIIDNAIIKYIG